VRDCLLSRASISTGLANRAYDSLFGLLNKTVTRAGGLMLRRWMLAPLVVQSHIEKRLDGVAFFYDIQNEEIRQVLVSLEFVMHCFCERYSFSGLVVQAQGVSGRGRNLQAHQEPLRLGQRLV
jgi:hypothetical protein